MNRLIAAAVAGTQDNSDVAGSRQIGTEVIRKAIHLFIAVVPFIAFYDLYLAVGLLGNGTLFYIFAEMARRRGFTILLVSDLTVIASRDQDRDKFVLGPVTLGIGTMLALLLYPRVASIIAIYSLAFGDSAASLVGKSIGGIRLPFSRAKTLAGTTACFSYRSDSNLPLDRQSDLIAYYRAFCQSAGGASRFGSGQHSHSSWNRIRSHPVAYWVNSNSPVLSSLAI